MTEYKFINLTTNRSIHVSKKFFDNSKLIAELLPEETECSLPDDQYNESVIGFLDNLFLESKLDDSKNLLMLTKALSLMDFLDIELHKDFLIEKASKLLYKIDIDILEDNIDEKFADNYKLVTLLWNKTENKKVFFKLPKLNYVNLSLNLMFDESINQSDFDLAYRNLKKGIIKINAHGRKDITDVNMFTQLVELDASYDCGIDQEGIQQLTNLRILYAQCNRKIKSVNHLMQLKKLDAHDTCGINQEGIQELTNLRILNAERNKRIKNVNHLVQLEELDASGSGIDQKGIQQLTNLRIFKASINQKITNVNHMTKLEELYCCGGNGYLDKKFCGIDQNGIQQLINLRVLNADYNSKIINVNHMTKLEELHAKCGCGIDQNGIQQLTNLRILDASCNDKITKTNMTKKN